MSLQLNFLQRNTNQQPIEGGWLNAAIFRTMKLKDFIKIVTKKRPAICLAFLINSNFFPLMNFTGIVLELLGCRLHRGRNVIPLLPAAVILTNLPFFRAGLL